MAQEDTSPQAINEEEHFQDNGNQDTLGIGDLPTPPPPAGSWKYIFLLYVSTFLTSWGDRLWQFAMPITLTTIYKNTLFPVAFFQSFSFMVCAFLGPQVGTFVDRFSRLFVASSSLIAQNVCVALSAVSMGVLLTIDAKDFDQTKPYLYYFPFSTWYAFVLFMVSMIFNSLSAISAMSSQVSKNKDWAVVVAKAYQHNLADVNANIRRIDLICNIVAPVAYALLETFTTPYAGIIFVTAWNLISFIPELLSLFVLWKKTPALQQAKERPEAQVHEGELPKKKENPITVWVKGWKTYFRQPVVLASLSIVFLYVTVLNVSSTMVSFLASDVAKMHNIGISVCRALTAVTGVIATLIAPRIITKTGVAKAGLVGIWFQTVWLYVALACIAVFTAMSSLADPAAQSTFIIEQVLLYGFVICVIISRIGLWTFDLAETQIMQLGIQEDERGAVNSAEQSLFNIAEFFVLVCSMIVAKPQYFIILAVVSAAFVQFAAIAFSIWNCTKHRRMIDELEAAEIAEDHQEMNEEELPEAVVEDEEYSSSNRKQQQDEEEL